jgi:hypothetical protein
LFDQHAGSRDGGHHQRGVRAFDGPPSRFEPFSCRRNPRYGLLWLYLLGAITSLGLSPDRAGIGLRRDQLVCRSQHGGGDWLVAAASRIPAYHRGNRPVVGTVAPINPPADSLA